MSVNATLGSRAANNASVNFGAVPNALYTYISYNNVSINGALMGALGVFPGNNHYNTSRYDFAFGQPDYPVDPWQGLTAITSRCAGQVGP